MNKWKEIANLLGLELEEEFYIGSNKEIIYWFGETGLNAKDKIGCVALPLIKLFDIINSPSLIIKKPWKPKKDETYYCYDDIAKGSTEEFWDDNMFDYDMWKIGNCFRTRKEADTKGKEIFDKLKEEYENA